MSVGGTVVPKMAYNVLQLQEVGDYESDRRSGTKLSATTKFDTKYKASFNH
jgi:hypothetical protein